MNETLTHLLITPPSTPNKMPKKTNSAKKSAAEKKNKNAVSSALETTADAIVGYVTGSLGNKTFRIKNLKSGTEVKGLIRGVFSGGRNSEGYIVPGMYVILTPSVSSVHEILGVINKKSDLKALKEAGLITEDEKDDLFDYSEDESETSPVKEDAEEVNIDDL